MSLVSIKAIVFRSIPLYRWGPQRLGFPQESILQNLHEYLSIENIE